MWNNIKSSSDANRHKAIYHSQEMLYTSVKPLLSLLDNLEGEKNKELCANAIQLICSSNLQLSRFRRAMASHTLNTDIRKSVLSLPVTHKSLFGQDFQKSVEEIIKVQASTSKSILPIRGNKSFSKIVPYNAPSFKPASSFNQRKQNYSQSRATSARRPFRGRYRGRSRPYSKY